MRGRKVIRPGERTPVRLTPRDRELIFEHTLIGGDVEERIRMATVDRDRLAVGLTLDDLDELLGFIAAEANHREDRKLQRQLDALYDRLKVVEDTCTDEEQPPLELRPRPREKRRVTPRQGQFLAYIYHYTKIHRRPPAEADIQEYFRVSAPAAHQMVRTLHAKGLIERVPGKARTVRILLEPGEIPDLEQPDPPMIRDGPGRDPGSLGGAAMATGRCGPGRRPVTNRSIKYLT